jgi:copper chaperone
MVTFQVSDMTCGHCAGTITRAIAAVDKSAQVEIQIPRRLVRVSSTASATQLAKAIQNAGYTARQVLGATEGAAAAAQPSGCGCGCGTPKLAPVDAGQQAAPARGSCCG